LQSLQMAGCLLILSFSFAHSSAKSM